MVSKIQNIDIDLRQAMKEHLTVRVQMKNTFIVWLGFQFLRFGCFLSGVKIVEEFPVSLIQNDKEVEVEKIGNFGDWLNKQ